MPRPGVPTEIRRKPHNEELEEVVYTVSHDLRQPIVGILGFASILKEDLEGRVGAEQRHFLERIIENAQKMDRFLGALLVLSRAAREVVDAQESLPVMLDIVATRRAADIAASGAQIERLPSLPETLVGAEQDITQLYSQLVANAVHFRDERRAPRIELGATDDAGPNLLHLWVRDNGAGIEARYQQEVFTICRKLSSNDPDRFGLGLAICKKIVEGYGGSIWLESTPGEGTTVHFTWPRS